jgi:hypothetical protein
MDEHDPDLSRAISLHRTKKRQSGPACGSLSERMHRGHWIIEVSWGNPYTAPPDAAERVLWSCALPSDEDYRAFLAQRGPAVVPGAGWAIKVGVSRPPASRWSDEAKSRVRRANLRRRLDNAVPLFAELFYTEELERRPDYFAGRSEPGRESSQAPAIGHNGGPRL